jgi:methionyl-tRNA formyltransferase
MSFRVVFMGTPAFAVPTLEALLSGPDSVVGVVTQPDRPAGRGRKLRLSPIKERALLSGTPVLEPERVRDDPFLQTLGDLAPDVIVVVAFGQILPGTLLRLPPRGCLNVHASLLPKYRGAAPVARAILDGETRTGVTIIQMEERLDAGGILLARETAIGPEEDGSTLSEKLSGMGAALLMEVLRKMETDSIRAVPQREEEATYAPRLRKQDGEISWRDGAERIARLVRGMVPWPVAHTTCGGRRLQIHRGKARGKGIWGTPGEIIRADHGEFWVAAGDGYLEVEQVQLENRARTDAEAFLLGHRDLRGTILGAG